ncbi:hypothetical protein VMCG_03846 [Cytospora schulzeri]|uniref:RING-type E3 ubiquitin transferase n=1 Tax=Cytospora schulzeri TaxID=448051 RepID=A0A423WUQ4_9PEZI|nr:hypothetical protein VMCG_03846 [Valsa malicola]
MGLAEGGTQDVQEQILKETLSGLSSHQNGDDTACCVICLSEISEPSKAQPCGHHNFDFLCLASWLSLKTTCPLCKGEISEVHYEIQNEGKTWKTYKIPKRGLETAPEARSSESEPRRNDTSSPFSMDSLLRRFDSGRRSFPWRNGSYRPGRARPMASQSSASSAPAQDPLEKRRDVYRKRLFSLHVGSNPRSRYRDVTPLDFSTSDDLQSRARAWIRRELQVFEFLSDESRGPPEDGRPPSEDTRRRRQNNAEFVLEYVIAILKTVDMQSGHAEDLLADFLGREHTKLFLHELRNFLRSPYSVEAWDRHVQYDDDSQTTSSPPRSGSAVRNRDGLGTHRRAIKRLAPKSWMVTLRPAGQMNTWVLVDGHLKRLNSAEAGGFVDSAGLQI